MWLVVLILLVVAIVLLVVGVISTVVVWGGCSVLYLIVNGVRQAQLLRELDTNSGIAPFVSLSLVNHEVYCAADDINVQMRVKQQHRLSRNLAMGGCAAILLFVLVTTGVGSFIIGAVLGIPIAVFIISRLGRLPVQARLIERKVNRSLGSIIERLESPALGELQQITAKNADLSDRLGVKPSNGLQNVVDYFNRNTGLVLEDPSLLEERVSAELAKGRQDNRRLEDRYWQRKEDRGRGSGRGSRRGSFRDRSDADDGPTPYETLGERADLPLEEIKRVYLELVKLYHPDKGIAPDGERLKRINVAWDRIREARRHRER